jgi:hypothetical protein
MFAKAGEAMSGNDDRVWYHVILTTYGAWLYGDPRGFRTRHHREHVEGDYKSPPPPGKYADQERRSRESLKQEPVVLPKDLRPVVGTALRERLEQLGVLVLCLSVGGQHVHILAKTPRGEARNLAGAAKLHAWHVLRSHGWRKKLWAKRGKEKPVRDREHQLNVYAYILSHAQEGAWVWKWERPKKDE